MQIASNDNTLAALGVASKADPAVVKRKAAALEAQAIKEKTAAQTRPADTVELSEVKPLAPTAQLSRTAAQDTPAEPAPVAPAATEQTTPASPDDLVASILKSFGARSGDEGFNAALDVNGDGVINFSDLNAAVSAASVTPPTGGPSPIETPAGVPAPQGLGADAADEVAPTIAQATGAPVAPSIPDDANTPDEPRVYTLDDIELALGAFGTAEGEDGFNIDFDFDGDGRINFGDLNELLTRVGGQTAQQTLISQLTELFGVNSNDSRFNTALDFDSDGVINFNDLNTLLSRLAENTSAAQG